MGFLPFVGKVFTWGAGSLQQAKSFRSTLALSCGLQAHQIAQTFMHLHQPNVGNQNLG
jgi:membrane protein YqaA with SNARE-associated domain